MPTAGKQEVPSNVLEGRPAAGTPAACTISPTNYEREVGVHKQRAFLLFAIFAAAAATPAWGQTPVPASGAQGAASIPDFSGMWGNPFLTGGLEPPPSGPGPVTNRSRRNGVSDIYQFVGDYTNPILKPRAAEAVKKHGEISLTGVTYPTPGNQCWPEPLPFIFRNFGMQILQQPHQITILYRHRRDQDRAVRHGRRLRHAIHRGPACRGTLSANRSGRCQSSARSRRNR
jgi:hypothetical protein